MNRAIRAVVTAVGAIMGLGGVEHGIGEMLQGSVAPNGLMIQSWPNSEFFRILQGEPAMTVIPNLLVTGVLSVLTSVAYLVCLIVFVERKWAPYAMMILSPVMILVGAGIFPPMFAFLMGLLAMRINAPLEWWRTRVSADVRNALGSVWPVCNAGCIVSWLLVLLGVPSANYFFGVDSMGFTLGMMAMALTFFVLAILTAFARDSRDRFSERPISLS